MSTLSYPNVIQNGQVADGDKLMENLNQIKAIINGDIDWDNIKASLINAANGIVKLDANAKVPMEQLLTNVANGTVKLDGNALVPLAQIPDTLTGKTAENADTVDGIHASTTGEAGKLIRADEVDDKITAHKNNASAHHTKTTSSEIDHGSIQGLGDDDHTQYLTTGRHDTTARHPVTVLKRATGSYSTGNIGADVTVEKTFAVHQFAFGSPQCKWSEAHLNQYAYIYGIGYIENTASYVRQWRIRAHNSSGSEVAYVQWDYLQSSPPYEIEHFIYLLIGPDGSIQGGWEAPDPPWKGQGFGITEENLPHPFLDKKENQKVILVNPNLELVTELSDLSRKLKKNFLEFINEGNFVISDKIDKPRGPMTEKIIAKRIEFRPLAKGKPVKV